MKNRILIGGMIVLCVIFSTLFFSARQPGRVKTENTPASGAQMARQAPEFSLADAKGHEMSLKTLRGNWILVHFWASWCGPCLEEIPNWLELTSHFKGMPIRFVAISLDSTWEEASKILPSEKVPSGMISLLDPEGQVADRFGSFQFPETYLINPDLQIMTKWVGSQDWTSKKMLDLLNRLLSKNGLKVSLAP